MREKAPNVGFVISKKEREGGRERERERKRERESGCRA
jgi:hypothetical protein